MNKEEIVMDGWHFLNSDYRLRYSDNRIVKPGEWVEMGSSIHPDLLGPELCLIGMHASSNLSDALLFLPSLRSYVLCRVSVKGDIVKGDDKFCGRFRKVLKWGDVNDGFGKFVYWAINTMDADRNRIYDRMEHRPTRSFAWASACLEELQDYPSYPRVMAKLMEYINPYLK